MATDTTLRPGEIKDILLREIEAADLHELDVEEVGSVLEVKDGIARIYGLMKAMAGEMLECTSSETGNVITALALNLEEDNIGAVILAYAVANFAGLVSVLPGGIGIYEALMTAVLVASGVPAAVSLPVTVMYRVVNTAVQIPIGYYFYHRTLQGDHGGR